MTDPTPDDLATLASAMGYTVTLDDSGGYGVVRVVIDGGFYGVSSRSVFCPHLDAAQAWEVMAWLAEHRKLPTIAHRHMQVDGLPYRHDGTAAGIRRAVVEAAIRVAKG